MAGMGPTRILVVDDDDASRELLRDYLSDAGYDVAVAADGGQACRLLSAFRADLVVTDLEMPVMDGLELIRWLRGATPSCPVVLVTGRSDRELQLCRFGRRSGFECMTKPIDVDQLGQTIATTDIGVRGGRHAGSVSPGGAVQAFVEMGELRRSMGCLAATEMLRLILGANDAPAA